MTPEFFKTAQKHLIKVDPTFRTLFKRHGNLNFKARLQREPYESLVRAIAHQQLHGKAAETILNRLLQKFPGQKFPTAAQLQALPFDEFRLCGFSNSKTKAILDIAEKTLSGLVPDRRKIKRQSNDEIIQSLTQIYGVGRWTVEMLLIFQLGRSDVWPIDDFGVRKGFQVWKKKRKPVTAKQLKPHGDKFAPYQSVVALYLWREADLKK